MKSKIKLKNYLISIFIIISIIFPSLSIDKVKAKEQEPTMAVYFTGIGCPHCAKSDPVVLNDFLENHPDIIVVEYEIYQQSQNAQLLTVYDDKYEVGQYIPLLIFNQNSILLGDKTIIDNLDNEYKNYKGNPLLLHIGDTANFSGVDFTQLPLYPKIWTKDRIAIRLSKSENDMTNSFIKEFLSTDNIENIFQESSAIIATPQPAALSGSSISFENAVKIDGWLLEWNGPAVKGLQTDNTNTELDDNICEFETTPISLAKTISLAAVDAVNPCALAVLTMMLVAIITYNPRNKKNIILAGLAFTTSVFIMYILYGLVIIRFFQLIQTITSIRLILYKVLAIAAIILGLLEIKDFIHYKEGSLGTEMPLSLRPKVKKIISGITSPLGAFSIGAFVTIFLLPCTIGPYVILGGMLSVQDILESLPHLLIYNIIFVLPIVVITILVYIGIRKVDDIQEWKNKNIKLLHLISGVIITLLGIAMLFGLI